MILSLCMKTVMDKYINITTIVTLFCVRILKQLCICGDINMDMCDKHMTVFTVIYNIQLYMCDNIFFMITIEYTHIKTYELLFK